METVARQLMHSSYSQLLYIHAFNLRTSNELIFSFAAFRSLKYHFAASIPHFTNKWTSHHQHHSGNTFLARGVMCISHSPDGN